MRSVWITRSGGPEVLAVRETPDPIPGPGQVRLRVRAAGLNFAELMARKGLYPDAPPLPCVVGYEAAGLIDAVGAGVTRFKEGDRALVLTRFGGHAEAVVVDELQAAPLPDGVSFEEGAAIPVNYLTAYHMMFRTFRIAPGDRVLIHMAAGGVGTAALQLCRTVPGVITFGTASASKHDYVRSHGCQHAIDYRSQDYAAEVKRLTGGEGVDLILDALGGPDWVKGYGLLRPGGLLVAFGWANMSTGPTVSWWHALKQILSLKRYTARTFMDDNKGIAGCNMGHMWDHIPMLRAELDQVLALVAAGTLKPHVDRVFSFEQAGEAHSYVEQGKNVGKVVLVP